MTKRRNGAGWNADLANGQKTAFTLPETKQLSDWFARQERWHDLALLSVALDSFLRAEDLLSLRVRDVNYSDGSLRQSIGWKQRKTKRAVHPELTAETQANLRIWVEASGKQPQHFLFTRSKPRDAKPITRPHFAKLIKQWAVWLGQPPDDYSTHSLRRSKPVHLFWQADADGQSERMLVLLSKLLGHKSVDVTTDYLGITQQRAAQWTWAHPMVNAAKLPPK